MEAISIQTAVIPPLLPSESMGASQKMSSDGDEKKINVIKTAFEEGEDDYALRIAKSLSRLARRVFIRVFGFETNASILYSYSLEEKLSKMEEVYKTFLEIKQRKSAASSQEAIDSDDSSSEPSLSIEREIVIPKFGVRDYKRKLFAIREAFLMGDNLLALVLTYRLSSSLQEKLQKGLASLPKESKARDKADTVTRIFLEHKEERCLGSREGFTSEIEQQMKGQVNHVPFEEQPRRMDESYILFRTLVILYKKGNLREAGKIFYKLPIQIQSRFFSMYNERVRLLDDILRETKHSEIITIFDLLCKKTDFPRMVELFNYYLGMNWRTITQVIPHTRYCEPHVREVAGSTIGISQSYQNYTGKNQDRWLVDSFEFFLGNKKYRAELYGVMDGHGRDAKAAEFVRDHLSRFLKETFEKPENVTVFSKFPEVIIQRAIIALDEEMERQECAFHRGTTLCAVLKMEGAYFTINVGDSRAVLVSGQRENYRQITCDHKNDRERYKKGVRKAGGLIYRCGSILRVDGKIAIARALGDHQVRIPHYPEVHSVEINRSDTVVIASDGVWDLASSQQIANKVLECKDEHPGVIAERIMWRASEVQEERAFNCCGDDITVMVIQFHDEEPLEIERSPIAISITPPS